MTLCFCCGGDCPPGQQSKDVIVVSIAVGAGCGWCNGGEDAGLGEPVLVIRWWGGCKLVAGQCAQARCGNGESGSMCVADCAVVHHIVVLRREV